MKKLSVAGLVIVSSLVGAGLINAQTVDNKLMVEELKRQLPNLAAPSIAESEIKGLYRFETGNQIYYWSPDGYLLIGEIYDAKKGVNLTALQRQELRTRNMKVVGDRIKKMSFENAVKIGNGKNIVIEFTDPDCPYCRKVHEYMEKQENVTRYVFLFPLKMHKYAKDKAAYILSKDSLADKVDALKKVYAGAFDKTAVPASDKKYVAMVQTNIEAGEGFGISGTPMLFINGEPVEGYNPKKMDMLLESIQNTTQKKENHNNG